MKVAIYGQKTNASFKDFIDDFFAKLTSKGVNYIIEKSFLPKIQKFSTLNLSKTPTFSKNEDLKGVCLMFTFGGDGTILEASTLIRDSQIPVAGINTGRLGFLATINKDSLFDKLDKILDREYKISQRSMIQVEADGVPIKNNFALNEISVTRRETTSMITVEAYMNGEFLNSFWADGLIISTPTGSTGYSLSCGGPIIHPENNNFIITPIAPHNLNVRPFIISDDSVLDLKIISRVNEYFLSMDTRNKPLSTSVKLKLKKCNFSIPIVEVDESTYLQTLREKLLWGSDKRN